MLVDWYFAVLPSLLPRLWIIQKLPSIIQTPKLADKSWGFLIKAFSFSSAKALVALLVGACSNALLSVIFYYLLLLFFFWVIFGYKSYLILLVSFRLVWFTQKESNPGFCLSE